MKHTLENNTLTVCLDSRIDVNNAEQVGEELLALADSAPGASIVLDAAELGYISSAGLRALLKLKKKVPGNLPVVNVSPMVYEIFKATGFTGVLDVQTAGPIGEADSWTSGNDKIEIVLDV